MEIMCRALAARAEGVSQLLDQVHARWLCLTYNVLNSHDLKSCLLLSSQQMISRDNYPGNACQPNRVNKRGPLACGVHLGSTGDLLYRGRWQPHTDLMGCFHVAPHVNVAP